MTDPRTAYDNAVDASAAQRDREVMALRAKRDAAPLTREAFETFDRENLAAEDRHTARKDKAREAFLAAMKPTTERVATDADLNPGEIWAQVHGRYRIFTRRNGNGYLAGITRDGDIMPGMGLKPYKTADGAKRGARHMLYACNG